MTRDEKLNELLGPHFWVDEFRCPHCKVAGITEAFAREMCWIRDRYGASITITSGFRCRVHNKRVGGAPRSKHPLGIAADCRVQDVHRFLTCVFASGKFHGIGPGVAGNPKIVHVDIRQTAGRVWTY